MPLCTLHLLALDPSTPNPLSTFLSTLQSCNISILVVSRVIRWVILPTSLSTEFLLARNIHWDLLLVVPNTAPLPLALNNLVQHHWSITAGVPSRLVGDFARRNQDLLHPEPTTVPRISEQTSKKTTDSAQCLELSSDLDAWIEEFVQLRSRESEGAISMFNLLSFNPGMKTEYLKYGKAFAESIGSAHGGNAKIVGNITHVNGTPKRTPTDPELINVQINRNSEVKSGSESGDWDEIALAHYPSIRHFRDMLLSEKYQEVNKRHRVPSLKDTAILMTSEVGIEEMMANSKASAKL